MKFFIRYFFRTLRVLLGPFMLLKEALTKPKGLTRSAAAQATVDEQCTALALYQFKTCPFCIKTRQEKLSPFAHTVACDQIEFPKTYQ